MSGAVRAATVVHTIADTGCETDFPVLAEVALRRIPRVGRPSAVVTCDTIARQILSGSSGSVHAGVC